MLFEILAARLHLDEDALGPDEIAVFLAALGLHGRFVLE
jgi:hypothetical protein